MSTQINCNQEISNFIETMVQILNRQNQNFTKQQMMDLFNEHLAQYHQRLQKEWQEQLLQAGFKNHGYLIDEIKKDIQDLDFNRSNLQQEISRSLGDKVSPERQKRMMIPPELSEKLEAAVRLEKLADHLQDRGGLSPDPVLLKNKLTGDLELKNRVIDPHWEKIREYQYMRNQYLSAKAESERTKIDLAKAEKDLNKLHEKNNSFYRLFNGGKKPDKAEHIKTKLKLENQIDDLKGQLMKEEETVSQIREKAYQAFREDAPLGGLFSSDHHITEKLDQLIAKERERSIEYQRDYRPPVDSQPAWRPQLTLGRVADPVQAPNEPTWNQKNKLEDSRTSIGRNSPDQEEEEESLRNNRAKAIREPLLTVTNGPVVNLGHAPQQEEQQQQVAQVSPAPVPQVARVSPAPIPQRVAQVSSIPAPVPQVARVSPAPVLHMAQVSSIPAPTLQKAQQISPAVAPVIKFGSFDTTGTRNEDNLNNSPQDQVNNQELPGAQIKFDNSDVAPQNSEMERVDQIKGLDRLDLATDDPRNRAKVENLTDEISKNTEKITQTLQEARVEQHQQTAPIQQNPSEVWNSYLHSLHDGWYNAQLEQMQGLANWYRNEFPGGTAIPQGSDQLSYLSEQLDNWWNELGKSIMADKEQLKINPFASTEETTDKLWETFTNNLTNWRDSILDQEGVQRQPETPTVENQSLSVDTGSSPIQDPKIDSQSGPIKSMEEVAKEVRESIDISRPWEDLVEEDEVSGPTETTSQTQYDSNEQRYQKQPRSYTRPHDNKRQGHQKPLRSHVSHGSKQQRSQKLSQTHGSKRQRYQKPSQSHDSNTRVPSQSIDMYR
jgi:hypothetical protein